MRFKGEMLDCVDDLNEYPWHVSEAVVTAKRIAFEWQENGDRFRAVLNSTDGGSIYKGCFGDPDLDKQAVMEAARYDSKSKDVLLVVRWYRKDSGNEGHALVRLFPE